MKLPSVMEHAFANVPGPQLSRSSFDRSHGYKTAFDAGDLIPFLVDEVLPGDTMNLSAQFFARMNSMIYPIMDNVFLDTFYFFVPTRILWTNWEKFNGAQDGPGDSIDFSVPILGPLDGFQFDELSIYDYMGLPTEVPIDDNEAINALPLRAYSMIWNEWFRDQNMQDTWPVSTDDGPDATFDYVILKRGKRHDYFTSCLPFAQKGDAVSIPLGDSAPVIGNGVTGVGWTTGVGGSLFGSQTLNGSNNAFYATGDYGDPAGTAAGAGAPSGSKVVGLTTDPTKSGMIADLSAATATTINDLREAIAFQQILERDARGGTRYVEQIKAHWGVTVPDFRLQRPEYLGGSSQRINVSAVAQTQPTPATPTPRNVQGGLAAYGTVADKSGFVKSFPEYGYVIGLVNVRADLTYQQGLRKMWSRQTRYDFALPALMHLGEQPVLQKEIFYNAASENTVFGYQERFGEYRYFPSQVTGPFRSAYTGGTLDAWHLALDFASAPTLDTNFIQDSPPMDRVLAVADEPNILLDVYVSLKHARCMPVYAVPGLERL